MASTTTARNTKPLPQSEQKEPSFVPFYEESAQIYMSLKLSKDGLSREEDTDVLKGMYDQDGNVQNVGWKVRRKIFGGNESNEPGSPPRAD